MNGVQFLDVTAILSVRSDIIEYPYEVSQIKPKRQLVFGLTTPLAGSNGGNHASEKQPWKVEGY